MRRLYTNKATRKKTRKKEEKQRLNKGKEDLTPIKQLKKKRETKKKNRG